jgi:hypothetical protein
MGAGRVRVLSEETMGLLQRRPSSRRARIIALTLAAVVALLLASVLAMRELSEWVRQRMETMVESRFDGSVEVDMLAVQLFPSIRMTGTGFRLRRENRRDVPPLITIGEFSATTGFALLWQRRVRQVTVARMEIYVPPDDHAGSKPDEAEKPREAAGDEGNRGPSMGGLVIEEIVSTDARLEVAPDDPDGTPLLFDIQEVRLTNFSPFSPAAYEARLVNPKPRGEIVTSGSFGPWNPKQPRQTPMAGDYTLKDADMSVFNGITGALTSVGRFEGRLEALDVTGGTTMPDFVVDTGGHPMRLDTTFVARVDGTNGNTYLDRVSARLGESPIEAVGEVAGTKESGGKSVRLHVTSDKARLEDFLYLVVPQDQPMMLGAIGLDTKLEIPPGEAPVVDKLRLDGRFTIRQGRFVTSTVQDKVDELSRRGQGKPTNTSIDEVRSEFGGRFTLRDGELRLPRLSFSVRGAAVTLAGTYGLRGGRLDFAGELRLDARLSQTTTGFRSFLLKLVDPFFAKDGNGTVLPIGVSGTVHKPEFGVRLLRRK